MEWVSNMSPSLQIKLATEVHLTGRRFLLEEQTLHIDSSPIYRAEPRKTNSFRKRGTEFGTKVNNTMNNVYICIYK
jgi:hypothetical protein